MEPELTQEQQQLADSARSFLARTAPLEDIAKAEDPAAADPLGLWSRCAELGWTGLLVPSAFGGAGASLTDAAVVADALGHALAPTPFVAVMAAVAALCAAPASSPAPEILERTAIGTAQPVLALTGHDGRWDPDQPAVRSSDGLLDGVLDFVSSGTGEGPLLVPATIGADLRLIALEPDQDGVVVDPRRLMGGTGSARITLERAVGADLGPARGAVERGHQVAAVLHGAWCAAASRRLLDDTVAYVSERHQFGVPIGSFQSVQHRLADAAVINAEATSLVWVAAAAHDTGASDARRSASTAFLRSTEAFVQTARAAHQVWGGMGYSTEVHVHLFSRRAKVARHEWGGPGVHLDLVAEELAAAPLLLERYLPRLGRS